MPSCRRSVAPCREAWVAKQFPSQLGGTEALAKRISEVFQRSSRAHWAPVPTICSGFTDLAQRPLQGCKIESRLSYAAAITRDSPDCQLLNAKHHQSPVPPIPARCRRASCQKSMWLHETHTCKASTPLCLNAVLDFAVTSGVAIGRAG
jgi:hypothetical protein